jgi:hypothetical protein
MFHRIAAALLFLAGAAVVALPIVLRLGWLAAMSGLIFGPALGVIAGVLWASDSPRAVGNTATPAAESPEPPPA